MVLAHAHYSDNLPASIHLVLVSKASRLPNYCIGSLIARHLQDHYPPFLCMHGKYVWYPKPFHLFGVERHFSFCEADVFGYSCVTL